jgi:phenylalanyl-tRNA synthetase beta chain
MNISYRWLQDLAPTITDSPREVADRLGMLGAPVDELVELSAEIRDVRIARVEEVRPHPNADRLRLCTVNAGGEQPLQVVCGAPNVEAGRFYPFAPVGASLPGGVEIRKAKLRGEVSEGMLCSARELGLGRDHAGLMTLAGEWEPGGSLVDALGLEDARLVVDVTPNRPELLSHLGVARELAPGGAGDIRLRPFSGEEPRLEVREVERQGAIRGVRVVIEDGDECPRYMAAVVRGVRVGPSPEWLATRLRSVGLRPINNVVDATNYVLHELGQPLHAFDLRTLRGGASADTGEAEIRVRRARQGEQLRTLDGVDRTLSDELLVIADADAPVALAGVMGGEETEVGEGTTDILLECALFHPQRVRRAARGLGLTSDAAFRFERGVDPELQPRALRRVVDLVLAVAGGEADPEALDVRPAPYQRPVVSLRPARASALLGVEVDGAQIAQLLHPIGFRVEGEGEELRVLVPGFRPDVTREVDLIEEVARRRGYDSFAEELPAFRPTRVPEDPLVAVRHRVRDLLVGWGFLEARTAGFAPAAENRVALLNPLSAEESHLRDALLPGLLRRVEHNWAHGVRDIRLYEIGTVFFPAAELPREEMRVAVVFTGSRRPPHWSGGAASWDVWDCKQLLAELARALGLGAPEPDPAADGEGLWAPGERFRVGRDGAAGRIQAAALDAPAWAEPVFALEVVLPESVQRHAAVYQPLPEFPAVERDLALLVSVGVASDSVEEVIRSAAGPLLQGLTPFDLYQGKGIPEGTRSIAFRLRFRLPERTLTDAEVDRAVQAVLQALADQLDVRLR